MTEPDAIKAHGLRWHRLNRGWTIDQLASRAGIARTWITHYENGRTPPADRRKALADALAVEPAHLAYGREPEPVPEPVPLRALRERRGLTVLQLAMHCELSPAHIYRAEAGAAVHPHTAKRLADFYGIAVTDFYPRDGVRGVAA
jgi:transcriptional regulator with XRE-family HTH domain